MREAAYTVTQIIGTPSSLYHQIKRGGVVGMEGGQAGRRQRAKEEEDEEGNVKRTRAPNLSSPPRLPCSSHLFPSAPPWELQRCTEELSGEGGLGGSGARAPRDCHHHGHCTGCWSEPPACQQPGEERPVLV